MTRIGLLRKKAVSSLLLLQCYYCDCFPPRCLSHNHFAAHAHPTMQSQQHTHDNNAPPAARPQPLHVVHSPTIPPPNRGSRNLKVPLTAPLPSRTTEVRSPNRRRPSPLVLGKPKEADPEDWQIHQERPFTASPGASDSMYCTVLCPIAASSL